MESSKPTGCYKCGRPGHWSRDCPSAPTNNSSNPNNGNPKSNPFDSSSSGGPQHSSSNYNTNSSPTKLGAGSSVQKKSVMKRIKPKLTPQLLVSDDGLGYVLRHFPRNFKYHGRGHEVDDLGNLLHLYKDWHSHLLPYYSFDYFVHKVEQVAATKRVKLTIKELRERVANGGDPTKLPEPPTELDEPTDEQVPAEGIETEELDHHQRDSSPMNHEHEEADEAMLHEIYEKATKEPSQGMLSNMGVSNARSFGNSGPSDVGGSSDELQITEEQRSRMEANRLKALQRNEHQITEKQRSRMEANRLKALQRAAARAQSRPSSS